jgi:type IV pilus assembly protein PilW
MNPARCFSSVVRDRQAGRTLIELLIAMALSLMIVAAVGGLYYFTSQSARTTEQLSTTEERGRLAMHFIGEPIMLAGYGNINSGELSGAGRTQVLSYKGTHLRACTNGRFVNPAANDFTCVPPPNGEPGDQMLVGHQAESVTSAAPQGVGGRPMLDCLGQNPQAVVYEVNPVPTIINLYSVERSGAGVLELFCRGGTVAARQSLLRDVENFKVFFALDTAGYLVGEVGQQLPQAVPSALRTATQINALPGAGDPPDSLGNPWNHVVAVYVCVQLRTSEAGTTAASASTFVPCPANETEAATGVAPVATNDGIARRSFTQVFTIRARAQADSGSQF